MKQSFLFIVFLFMPKESFQFSFAAYYQDNMVLQRAPYQAIIWGYADLNSNISLLFKNKEYFSIAKSSDVYDKPIWKIRLDPVIEKNSFTLEFREKEQKYLLRNVLFGDIWLCGGQSNMQLTLKITKDGQKDIETGSIYKDKIRLFTVETFSSTKPELDLLQIKQNWSEPSPHNLGNDWNYFSAVCWHFGKKLSQNLEHPIGLVVSCWAGTEIERWMSPETLKKCNVTNQNFNHSESWNSMIYPLLSFPIFGAIWYQGESNTVYNRDKYGCNFEKMIDSWRENWYEKTNGSTNLNFPFGFVQLANSDKKGDFVDDWVWIRWQQTAGYGYSPNEKLKNVFMATAIDLVDDEDHLITPIHPRLKEDVGTRLSLGALNLGYGKKTEFSPPKVKSVIFNGKNVIIYFVSSFGDFEFDKVKYKNFTKGFDVCCDSNTCYTDNDQNWFSLDTFTVHGMSVSLDKPQICDELKYIRYLWRNKPCEFKSCPLYISKSGLPIYPFINEITYENSSKTIKNCNILIITILIIISHLILF